MKNTSELISFCFRTQPPFEIRTCTRVAPYRNFDIRILLADPFENVCCLEFIECFQHNSRFALSNDFHPRMEIPRGPSAQSVRPRVVEPPIVQEHAIRESIIRQVELRTSPRSLQTIRRCVILDRLAALRGRAKATHTPRVIREWHSNNVLSVEFAITIGNDHVVRDDVVVPRRASC
jgi:hypothetical protein